MCALRGLSADFKGNRFFAIDGSSLKYFVRVSKQFHEADMDRSDVFFIRLHADLLPFEIDA